MKTTGSAGRTGAREDYLVLIPGVAVVPLLRREEHVEQAALGPFPKMRHRAQLAEPHARRRALDRREPLLDSRLEHVSVVHVTLRDEHEEVDEPPERNTIEERERGGAVWSGIATIVGQEVGATLNVAPTSTGHGYCQMSLPERRTKQTPEA